MLLGMLFETLGIGLIVPAFSIITDPNSIEKYIEVIPFLSSSPFFDSSNFLFNEKKLITLTVFTVLFVYVAKTFFLAYLLWKQTDFIKNVNINWSSKLFSGYLHLPYSFHLRNNSNYLLNNIFHCSTVSTGIESCLVLTTEILVILGIGSILLIIEPLGAITVIIVTAACSYFLLFYTKKRLLDWGKKRHMYDGEKVKQGRQTFDGIKDLKILGRQKNFLDIWTNNYIELAKIQRNVKVFQVIPRLWLELVTIFGLSVLLIAMSIQGKNFSTIIPVLGVFAAAAFRLMPSVNRILGCIQMLRVQLPQTKIIHEEIKKTIQTNEKSKNKIDVIFKNEIEIKNLNYAYESRPGLVLSNINIKIPVGSQVGFVGESGSGKTTLIDIILGLLKPTNGSVKVDGKSIEDNYSSWQKQIGYVPQDIYLTDDTLMNNVAFGLNKKNGEISEKDVSEAIKAANLDTFVKSLPEGLYTIVGEKGIRLSGGQRQRIGIARALYNKPKVLVLDEATSSLDTQTENEILKEVSYLKGKKTIIIVAHRMNTVSNCNKLYKLDEGKIIKEGTFSEVVNYK